MRIALFQPDIPQNAGTLARFCRCMGLELHIIEPAGFTLNDKDFRRAGLDYLDKAVITRHVDFSAFENFCKAQSARIILLSSHAATPYLDFTFAKNDMLLFGRESAGAPDYVHDSASARLCIPMCEGARSLNLALSAAMVAGEAVRQTALPQRPLVNVT